MAEFNVLWNRYDEKFQCVVGYLMYDVNSKIWTFFYDEEGFSLAYTAGFRGFAEFPNVSEIYQSTKLFDVFSERIHRNNSQRTGYLTEIEKVDLLETVGASLNTDNIDINRKRPRVYGKN